MNARITSNFTAASTAEEVATAIDLTGKHIVITGATSGIGIETARVLLSHHADVTLAVRHVKTGQQVSQDLVTETGNQNSHVAFLDLSNPKSIVNFAKTYQGPLDILINNAGVMNIPTLTLSHDGYEMQFITNYLGHFALSYGLHDALAKAHGRIVSVSSSAHLHSDINWDDLNFKNRPYQPEIAYAQSKTAVNLFDVGVSLFWKKDGITANALMPGAIQTKLQRYIPKEMLRQLAADANVNGSATSSVRWKSLAQGAATTVFVATSPSLAGVSGHYFENSNEICPNDTPLDSYGVADYSLNPQNATKLWQTFEPVVKTWYREFS